MAETVADDLRGLAQMDLAKLALDDPNDPFAAAYPTFGMFTPPGATTNREEVVLLRQSIATVPHPRMSVDLPLPDARAAWELNEMPVAFRAVNPVSDRSDRGFPTYTYGRTTQNVEYINAVRITGNFQVRVFPDSLVHDDPTAVVAMFRIAHFFARQKGFKTGFPTFNRVPIPGTPVIGNEVVVFPADSYGVVLNSDPAVIESYADGRQVTGFLASWTFESIPMITDKYGDHSAFALARTADNEPLFFNGFDGRLFQYRHRPQYTGAIDQWIGTAAGPAPLGRITSMASADADEKWVHVFFADVEHAALEEWPFPQLYHGARSQEPIGDFPSVMRVTAEGDIGQYNQGAIDPSTGIFHALAYGGEVDQNPGLLQHFSYPIPNSWGQRDVVDGDGADPDAAKLGHLASAKVREQALVFEWVPSGPTTKPGVFGPAHQVLHAFYVLEEPEGFRLRHAESSPWPTPGPWLQWSTETLDGSGGSEPPPALGTGPTRASVGTSPTAVVFNSAIWCIYNDETYGNLRVARGHRDAVDGHLVWDFQVLDGSGRHGQTRNTVQSAAAVVWENKLSVFYIDRDRGVLRHAWRGTDNAPWKYEVVDGDGGPDGRVDAPIVPPVAAIAARDPRTEDQRESTPRLPVSVAYHWESPHTPKWSNVRLATYASLSSVPVGATARCKDGTYSFAPLGSGACSGHGGVEEKLIPVNISPTHLDFGRVKVGTDSAWIPATLTNHGANPFGPIDIYGGDPPTAEFNASQNCQGTTLGPGGSCGVWYMFSPSAPGVFNDASSFTISGTGVYLEGKNFTVILTGTGV